MTWSPILFLKLSRSFFDACSSCFKPWSDNQINIPRNIICGNFDLYWQTKLLWCLYFGKSSDHIICEHTIYRRQSFRSIISPNIVLFSGSNNRVWLVLPIYLHCRGFSKGLVKNHITHTKGGIAACERNVFSIWILIGRITNNDIKIKGGGWKASKWSDMIFECSLR